MTIEEFIKKHHDLVGGSRNEGTQGWDLAYAANQYMGGLDFMIWSLAGVGYVYDIEITEPHSDGVTPPDQPSGMEDDDSFGTPVKYRFMFSRQMTPQELEQFKADAETVNLE